MVCWSDSDGVDSDGYLILKDKDQPTLEPRGLEVCPTNQGMEEAEEMGGKQLPAVVGSGFQKDGFLVLQE